MNKLSKEEIIEELRNKNAELRDELEVKNAELNNEKEKNNRLRKQIKIYRNFQWHNKDDEYWVNRIFDGFEEILNDGAIEDIRNFNIKLIQNQIDNLYISKDKIKAKIEELEKQQEENSNLLNRAIDILNNYEIDKYSNRISVNMSVRVILQELLEEK